MQMTVIDCALLCNLQHYDLLSPLANKDDPNVTKAKIQQEFDKVTVTQIQNTLKFTCEDFLVNAVSCHMSHVTCHISLSRDVVSMYICLIYSN